MLFYGSAFQYTEILEKKTLFFISFALYKRWEGRSLEHNGISL